MLIPALCLALAVPPPPEAVAPALDLTPLRAPLDRAATALEKALDQVETFKADVARAVNYGAAGGAALVTMLVMHTLHLHGLAASKANRKEGA